MRRATIGPLLAVIGVLAASAALAPVSLSLTPTPAPKPPLVSVGSIEQVSTSTASLKARIDPEGSATTYYFQYGPTTAYGLQTPPASAGSGIQEEKFTQVVAGLAPYTVYHFRVLATNSAGTTTSADATFTTKKVPLSLTSLAAPNPVAFGSPLTLSGTLSGTGNAGVEIILQDNPYPYTHGFRNLTGATLTDASGNFTFPLTSLSQSTQLRVATLSKPAILSPPITELVAVRVTLHVRPARRRGFVRLRGTVTPAEPGALVAFERIENGRYLPVSGTKIKGRSGGISRFARTIRLRRRGLYRALVQVAGGALVSGRSRPVLIR